MLGKMFRLLFKMFFFFFVSFFEENRILGKNKETIIILSSAEFSKGRLTSTGKIHFA